MKSTSFTFKLAGPSPRDPLSIFHLAQGFFLAGQRCLLEIAVAPGTTQCLVSPGVVNLCFSIELFMKSLIVLQGQASPKTHKFAELAALLPATDIAQVRVLYQQQVQKPSLDELLAEVSQFFVKLRYEYEFDIFSFNEHPVSVLADALYRHCAERNKSQSQVSGVRT